MMLESHANVRFGAFICVFGKRNDYDFNHKTFIVFYNTIHDNLLYLFSCSYNFERLNLMSFLIQQKVTNFRLIHAIVKLFNSRMIIIHPTIL